MMDDPKAAMKPIRDQDAITRRAEIQCATIHECLSAAFAAAREIIRPDKMDPRAAASAIAELAGTFLFCAPTLTQRDAMRHALMAAIDYKLAILDKQSSPDPEQ